MTDKIKQSKLGTRLQVKEIGQTRSQIKFTDYAIERYTADFINPKTGKSRKDVMLLLKANNFNG